MTIFVLACSVLFLILALVGLRYAFFLYVGLLPFMPAYLAIPLGIGGAGISLQRIFTYVLLLCIFTAFVRSPQNWLNVIRLLVTWRVFLLGLIVLYVAKLSSTLMLNEPVGLAYWFDEVAEIVIALLLGIRFIDSMQAVRTFFLVVTASFLFCELIVLIEYAVEHNLLQGLITVEVTTVGEKVLSGFDRDGRYRTMALFDNPLSLSEFVVIGAIFSYGAYKLQSLKWLPWLALLLTFPVIYSTGSRSGMLLLCVLLALLGYLSLVKYLPVLRLVVRLLLVPVFVGVLSVAYFAISDPDGFIGVTSFLWGGDSSSNISTLYRLMQYPLIFTAMLDNPLFGYGVKNHFIQDLNTPLDNYYLRVLIEGGLIGLSAFLVQVLFVAKFVASGERLSQLTPAFSKQLYMVVKLYIFSFIGYKIFVSMSHNNIYFYLVCGALIGLSAHRNSISQNGFTVGARERGGNVNCKKEPLWSSKNQDAAE